MIKKEKIDVLGRKMAYVEAGSGRPVVFLHGNPTSSYLWRNIIPRVSETSRCIAPDLIGMGDSDKLENSGPDSYSFIQHREFVDEFLRLMDLEEDIVLVVHDWGSALGFDWAYRHPDAVRGIAYMEALVKPFSWKDQNPEFASAFKALRSSQGEQMVLQDNIFVEQILPSFIQRTLSNEEMDEYRRPYIEAGESRRPTLTWPREIPFDGDPDNVFRIIDAYSKWLPDAAFAKLFVNVEPGVITGMGNTREFCRSFSNQTELTVEGLHYVQEDAGQEIGIAISSWLDAQS
jgi:haloalkane dehalogenase